MQDNLSQQFNQIILSTKELLKKNTLRKKQTNNETATRIVIGLSGGPDSVVLLYLLYTISQEIEIELVAAHLDHGWRSNSADDVAWCKELCKKLSIPFYHEHANNIHLSKKITGSAEAQGRLLRRTFFENLATKLDADLIALGHHADDQQETFFLRLIRGSSLSGLCCMNTFAGNYFRPLLSVSKKFILAYLQAHNIDYLIDYTNESTDYLRNRIRKLVLPALQACDERFDKNILSTIQNLREEDNFLDEITQQNFSSIFSKDHQTNQYVGNLPAFKQLHPVLQKRILIFWFIQVNVQFTPQLSFLHEVIKFLTSHRGGTHQLHTNWAIIKKAQKFWIV